MTEPRTEAGRAYLAKLGHPATPGSPIRLAAILAIEQEAAANERRRIMVKLVRGPVFDDLASESEAATPPSKKAGA